MKPITIKNLFPIFDGISIDIFTRKDQQFYAFLGTKRPRIDSVRWWDFRYENNGTHMTLSHDNTTGGHTTLYYPKNKHFEVAAHWEIMDVDLVRMIFECEVRINA